MTDRSKMGFLRMVFAGGITSRGFMFYMIFVGSIND